jgi:hypothetical protein
MTSVLGYLLLAHDNGSHMYGRDSTAPRCSECGFIVDRTVLDPGFRLRRRTMDVSFTYDHCCVVSERFRSETLGLGASFQALIEEPGFYTMNVDSDPIRFDSEARHSAFDAWCCGCERFTQVAGLTPVYLVDWEPLPERFSRTDVSFGSGDELSPAFLVGPILAQRLRKLNFRGLELEPIVQREAIG